MILANAYALTAVDAVSVQDMGSASADTDGLGGAVFQTVCTAFAQFLCKTYGMIRSLFHLTYLR